MFPKMDSEKYMSVLPAFLLEDKKIKNEVLEDITGSINETEIEEATNPTGLMGPILSFEQEIGFQVNGNEGCRIGPSKYATYDTSNVVQMKTEMTTEMEAYICNNFGIKRKYTCGFKRRYQREVNSNGEYFCDQCDFTSLRKLELSEHKVLIHNAKVMDDKKSKEDKILKGQIMTYVKTEILDKDLEGKASDLLNLHLTRIKDEYDSDTCCEFHERTFRQSRSHIIQHCKTCSYVTRYTQKMFCHYRQYQDHKAYQCDECSMSSTNSKSLSTHKRTQHSKVIIWYNCDQCEFKCRSRSGVVKHNIAIHQPRKSFICNECASEFNALRKLKEHILWVHTDKDKRPFSCDLCSFKAVAKYRLEKHKEMVHSKTYQHKYVFCEYCGKKFMSQHLLNNHLVKIHKQKLDLQNYICYTCGYQNSNKPVFTKHVTRHLKHEQFFCANCDYKTYFKIHLIQHMVKHMKHVKMHKCDICSFETKRPHTLRAHIKTHLNLLNSR